MHGRILLYVANYFGPTIDSVKSIFVRLQADDTPRADKSIVNHARGQVEPVACFQGQIFPSSGKPNVMLPCTT